MNVIDIVPQMTKRTEDKEKIKNLLKTLRKLEMPKVKSVDGHHVLQGLKDAMEELIDNAEADMYEFL